MLMTAATDAAYGGQRIVTQAEERRVIFASSLGTVFEWYDFYLYAVLAPFFAVLFFPPGNQTAALLSAFAAYAAGFLVGLLPTFASVGWLAPILMVTLRLVQGLALGGEYGGAATYVAEHAPHDRRGYDTSWIQTTATLGFFLALIVIGLCRWKMGPDTFKNWGWRIPFLMSLFLLAFSIYIRLKLQESPIFKAMK